MPPSRSRPKNLAGYLAALSRPVFSAGMSWRVVEAKWDGIRKAFADFDPQRVAAFGPDEVDRLVADEAVIRSRPKIEAVIENAQTLLDLDAEYKGFSKYLRSHDGYEALVSDLHKRFRFIGPAGAYTFLYMVGEEVPPHEEWTHGRARGGRSRSGRPRGSAPSGRAPA
jgi:DNA-3-methyladenine glycosylase I